MKRESEEIEDVFLTEAQVDYMTGIKRGQTIDGHPVPKHALQVKFLRSHGVPFIENARGKPIVARSILEGRKSKNTEAPRKRWQPSL